MAKPDCLWNCGRKANSVEDVVPEWAREQLGARQSSVWDWQVLNIESPRLVRTDVPVRERVVNAFRVKAKAVCIPCNNGWMSDIQQAAKPVMGPMMDGQPRTLGPLDKGIVATWAAMTGITLGYSTEVVPVVLDLSRRVYLYTHHSTPPNTIVCLARIEEPPDAPHELRTLVGLGRSESILNQRADVHMEFITMGKLGILVFQGVLYPSQHQRLIAFARTCLLKVWPTLMTWDSWPPRQALTATQFAEVAQEVLLPNAPNPTPRRDNVSGPRQPQRPSEPAVEPEAASVDEAHLPPPSGDGN